MAITGPIPLPPSILESILQGAQIGQAPIQSDLLRAQAKREQARANLPFGGDTPPGPAGQIVGLEMVKKLYGEDSPQYKEAKGLHDLNKQSSEARINYQNILSETSPKRFSTALGKTSQELEDIKQGFLPGTKIPLTDDQKKYYTGVYGLDIQKKTSDSDTRKRNLFSRNIDVTLSKINPDHLTQYSGLKGMGEYLKDKNLSLTGKAPEKYKQFERSLTASKTLAKQARQFFGDSITPEVQRGLKELTNPSSWLQSPEIAKEKYNAFVDLLKTEAKTYQLASESPDIYKGNVPIEQQDRSSEEEISPEKTTSSDELAAGNVGIYSPEGTLVARGTKKQAAKFLADHKGYYQKVID